MNEDTKVNTDILIVGGIEYSREEVIAMAAELKDLTAVVKEARKSGMLKKAAIVREDDPRKLLLAELFEGIIVEQIDIIQELFDATRSNEKPLGNTGVNIRIKDIDFDIQILSDVAKKAKTDAGKRAKADMGKKAEAEAAEKAKEYLETIEAKEYKELE